MDQSIINLLFATASALVGWWCREIWTSLQKLREDLQKLEVNLPEKYCSKIDIEKRLDRIDRTLDQIWNDMKEKADKQ